MSDEVLLKRHDMDVSKKCGTHNTLRNNNLQIVSRNKPEFSHYFKPAVI